MTSGRTPAGTRELLAKVGRNKRTVLVRETWEKYFEILDACARRKSIGTLVRDAEALFRRRKNVDYYADGISTGGGGPDNDVTVDYALAAVLAWCTRKSRKTVETIHAWRW